MHKTLVLGVLLVFALSVHVASENHQLISTSETETISAIGTPQMTSVSPKTNTPKAQAARKAPQVNPLIVAANNMLDAASQMALQFQRYQRESYKLSQNLGLSQNLTAQQKQFLRDLLAHVQADEPRIDYFRQAIQVLVNGLHSVFTPSKTN